MAELIMPGDAAAPNGLSVEQGIANWAELEKRVNELAVNCALDGGRFVGESERRVTAHSGDISAISVSTANGSARTASYESRPGSTTFGGNEPAADPVVEEFLSQINTDDGGRRNCCSFYISEFTQGDGTTSTIDSLPMSLACGGANRSWGGHTHKSVGFYVQRVSGSLGLKYRQEDDNLFQLDGQRIDLSGGGDQLHLLTDDDWHFYSAYQYSAYPYIWNLGVHASEGSVYRIAWHYFSKGRALFSELTAPLAC